MNYLNALLIIGFAVLFHELGHFIAAKLVKLPIGVFSVGFGPRLLGFRKNGTDYRISAVPLGGYVLPDIKDEKEFFLMPVNKRIIMTLGGPAASFLLPYACFILLELLKGAGFSACFTNAAVKYYTVLAGMIAGFAGIFSGGGGELSGILGIVMQGGKFIGTGASKMFTFAALLSMNLGVLNMIPVPAFDGGKFLLYLLEKIDKRLVRLHVPAAMAGWVIIIGLLVYTSAVDLIKYLPFGRL